MTRESGTKSKGNHKGNTTEALLNQDIILKELDLQPGQTIMDVGCANGYMSKKFAIAVQPSGKIFALDHAKKAIDKLKKETSGTNIKPLHADITRETPVADKSVDLIYLSAVFHIFTKEQIKGFHKEIKRLLKPRGKLAIIEIHKEDTPFGPPMDMRYSPAELRQTIQLKPVSLLEAGPYFYMQVFENENK